MATQVEVAERCRFVSKGTAGMSRAAGDRQFLFLNGRPIDLPKVSIVGLTQSVPMVQHPKHLNQPEQYHNHGLLSRALNLSAESCLQARDVVRGLIRTVSMAPTLQAVKIINETFRSLASPALAHHKPIFVINIIAPTNRYPAPQLQPF